MRRRRGLREEWRAAVDTCCHPAIHPPDAGDKTSSRPFQARRDSGTRRRHIGNPSNPYGHEGGRPPRRPTARSCGRVNRSPEQSPARAWLTPVCFRTQSSMSEHFFRTQGVRIAHARPRLVRPRVTQHPLFLSKASFDHFQCIGQHRVLDPVVPSELRFAIGNLIHAGEITPGRQSAGGVMESFELR